MTNDWTIVYIIKDIIIIIITIMVLAPSRRKFFEIAWQPMKT